MNLAILCVKFTLLFSLQRSKLSSSMSEVGKYMGDLVEYAFFDKVNKNY